MRGRVAHRLIRFDPERAPEMHSLSRVSIDERNPTGGAKCCLIVSACAFHDLIGLFVLRSQRRDFVRINFHHTLLITFCLAVEHD